jgi:hypothetical protein
MHNRPPSLVGFRWLKGKQRHQNFDTMHTHPILFVFRVEFIEAIVSPAVRSACLRDAITILQFGQTTEGYNVPFCGLIQGVSSKQRSGFYMPCSNVHSNCRQTFWSFHHTLNCNTWLSLHWSQCEVLINNSYFWYAFYLVFKVPWFFNFSKLDLC